MKTDMKAQKNNFLIMIWLFLFSIVIFSSYDYADPDYFGHLKFGQTIFEMRSIPKTDFFSYTAKGLPWTNHEWLSEVIFWIVYYNFSDIGFMILRIFIGLLFCYFLWKILNKENILAAILTYLLVLFAINPYWHFRPQIFTFLFFAVLLWAILQKKIWYIPLIFIFWANLHGGFVSGLVLLFLSIFYNRGNIKKYIIVFFLSVTATLLNPYGLNLWFFIIRAFFNPYTREFICDWRPLLFFHNNIIVFVIAFCLCLYLIVKIGKNSFDVLAATVYLFLSLSSSRHIPFFLIVSSVIVSRLLGKKLANLNTEGKILILIIGMSFTTLLVNPKTSIRIDKKEYPVNAVNFIKSKDYTGNIYCEFDWGEYIIWYMYPGMKVSIDGRYDTVYPIEFIKEVFEGRDEIPQGSDFILIYTYNPLLKKLENSSKWNKIYSDNVAVLFKSASK